MPFVTRSHGAGDADGVALGAPEIIMLTVPVSDVAPAIPVGSPIAVTVHVPAVTPVAVSVDPEDCHAVGDTVHVGSAVCTSTGSDDGVPAGTPFGFVSVACAVNVPVAPMPMVAGAPVIVT